MSEQLPQNIKEIIKQIGENQVLLRLGILCHKNVGWEVFRNVGEAGYDILISSSRLNCRIRIEVKTRQQIFTTGKQNRTVQFNLTKKEYEACDFLIAHFIDQNRFYIVHKSELKPVSGGTKWRFNLSRNKNGIPHPRFEKYENAWGGLHPSFGKQL